MKQKFYYATLCCIALVCCIRLHAQDSWVLKNNVPMGYRSNPVCFSIGNKAYYATGLASVPTPDLWEYDPSTDTWTQRPDLPGNARYAATGFSIGNKGYVGTGYDGSSYLNDFWEYDATTMIWTAKATFPGGSRSDAVGFSIGSKGYIGTGEYASGRYNNFYEYDTSTGLWTQIASLSSFTRAYATAFTIGSKGYVGLGITGSTSRLGDLWEYDPSTGNWTQRAYYPGVVRTGASGFSIGDRGYMGFGYDGSQKLHDLFEYDPVCDKWNVRADVGFGARRSAAGAFSLGNKGYIATGTGSTPGTNTLYEYTPYKLFTQCISGTSYCSGSSITVPYTSSNIVFNSGNVFTAQLSDASGSFASPTTIGTLTSTASSGTISATIPGNAATGYNYRVRVVSSNVSSIGSNNGTNLSITGNDFPWSGNVYTSRDQSIILQDDRQDWNYICENSVVYFNAGVSPSDYSVYASTLSNTPYWDGYNMTFTMDPGAWVVFSVNVTINGCPKTLHYTFFPTNCDYAMYSLAPNPATSDLVIYVDDEKLKKQKIEKSPDQVIQQVIITDKLGNVLRQQKYPTNTKKININVSGLAPDIYVSKIFNGKNWTTIKFIKK
jgi:N-acetylneuraminic acid mutarotase